MFTRRHYRAVANVLCKFHQRTDKKKQTRETIDEFCTMFKADNSRFDSDKFRNAANVRPMWPR